MADNNIRATVSLDCKDEVAIIRLNNPPVNALSFAMRQGLYEAIVEADRTSLARAIVIAGEGKMFCAGADVSDLANANREPSLPKLARRIEDCGKPVVVLLHDNALGGGCEIALAAHGRVATTGTKIGLPEVTLGLLPGAGGTQRLPRLVGLGRAFDMILGGKPISAETALEWGLVDGVSSPETAFACALDLALALSSSSALPARTRELEIAEPPALRAELRDGWEQTIARRHAGEDAPMAIVTALVAAAEKPFDEAIVLERELFLKLRDGPQATALHYLFVAERALRHVPGLDPETPASSIASVGIIGAGTMGTGIALALLAADFAVTLVEREDERLDAGLKRVADQLAADVAKGRISLAQREQILHKLTGSTSLAEAAQCDLLIEAVFENLELKRAVFAELDALASSATIIASNTSYLDLDTIAGATGRADRVLGLHFFSPANIMPLLEIVRGAETSAETLATGVALARRLGKTGVVVGNGNGFVGNRILLAREAEADAMALEGTSPYEIDRVMRDFGFRIGHYEMRDMAGLDIAWNRRASSSSSIREVLNEHDRHGVKAGGGYYDYPDGRKPVPSSDASRIISEFRAAKDVPDRPSAPGQILERLLMAMLNEAGRLLDEGIASRASDVDIVLTKGYGWPRRTGGLMHWASTISAPALLERMARLESLHGPRFAACNWLKRLASERSAAND